MQLTRSRKIIGGLALAGTMALSGIVGFAQQGTTQGTQGGGKDRGSWGRGERGGHKKGGMRGGGFGRFAENLNLTDAQKAQIEQITARYRETAKAGRQQRQGRGERGFDAFGGGTFNEAEVRAAAQARANAQVEREVARARMMSELYNVLTAEQKAQLAAQRQQREQKRQERRTRRNADGAATPASRT
ncbi:MAG: Spy/CpxP family protein refolding chaperone [Acidobacteria bacterium]|nr:Spy/CpxP family protein refolding chaperone [Acidobacteriota bacterium]